MNQFMTTEPEIHVPGDVKTLMQVLNLPPMEAKFLHAMLATTRWIGPEELPEIKYSTRQLVFKLRNRMASLKVWVINDGEGRYSIPPTGKLILKAIIEKALTPRVTEEAHGG